MKQHTYFLLLGLIALIEVCIFIWSVEHLEPWVMMVAVIVGILAAWIIRQLVDEVITDERTHLITEKASLRTLQVLGVILFSYALGGVVISLRGEVFGPFSYQVARFSFLLMFIVFLMIIVYVLFLSWYERKYGAGGEDEE
ncbi:MAG: DUF2178 domain-containing protein [Methanospirillum sp.]|uniref:DUF2178 domain-containing protein n=1 Tax=Methanospirillum sp. TaxID=45200 RepID=UPI0023707747|nr:DUF2178 domain-containing protein [Methanospirillum sp.]MDD1728141.1 DUF2178 domain-containing protein [Methanospirillum sp.]